MDFFLPGLAHLKILPVAASVYNIVHCQSLETFSKRSKMINVLILNSMHNYFPYLQQSIDQMTIIKEQAQRRAAADRSRHTGYRGI